MEAGICPLLSPQSGPDLGAIFRDLGEPFLERKRLTQDQKRVFRRIGECRTAAMGGTLWRCHDCGRWVGVYHSCRDRHCPQCQQVKSARWTADRLEEQLPGPSFHVVFTLPHELNPLVLSNPKPCLNLLFRCASRTLLEFASDPKYLGALPGIVMVLHTWGQQMNLHYHVHCIVSAGGLSATSTRWVEAPNPRYLFPTKPLSQVFRGKYLSGLDEIWRQGLRQPPGWALQTEEDWIAFKRRLANKKQWNVYIKPPFSSTAHLVKYLAQYTHRVAISNQRILFYRNGQVGIRYKNYRKKTRTGYRQQTLILDADDFAHRFLLHVLPRGFMRIRYYGLLASCRKKKSLTICRTIFALRGQPPPNQVSPLHENQTDHDETGQSESIEGLETRKCPYCREGILIPIRTLTSCHKKIARALLWDTS